MRLTPEQRRRAENGQDVDGSGRKRDSSKFPKWPRGVIVYEIGPNLGKSSITVKSGTLNKKNWSKLHEMSYSVFPLIFTLVVIYKFVQLKYHSSGWRAFSD